MEQLQIAIPKELENLKLPSPELIDYYRDFKNRHIYIDFDIDESLIEVSKQILLYNMEDKDISPADRKPIYIYIYSYGGDLSAVFSTIAVMQASITPVVTVNMGVAMSAALLLLLAGHIRYGLKWSQVLAHSGSSGALGTFEQMEERQRSYKRMVDDMKDYILSRTSIDEKTFNRNKTKDWYIFDNEQVKYKIVDKIVESLDEIL